MRVLSAATAAAFLFPTAAQCANFPTLGVALKAFGFVNRSQINFLEDGVMEVETVAETGYGGGAGVEISTPRKMSVEVDLAQSYRRMQAEGFHYSMQYNQAQGVIFYTHSSGIHIGVGGYYAKVGTIVETYEGEALELESKDLNLIETDKGYLVAGGYEMMFGLMGVDVEARYLKSLDSLAKEGKSDKTVFRELQGCLGFKWKLQ